MTTRAPNADTPASPWRLAWIWGQKILSWVPFKEVILIALLLQGFKEFFPFSHFPMYSQLPPDTDYFYLTDAEGTLIGQQSIFGVRAARMKKIYVANLKEEQQDPAADPAQAEARAGRRTLDYLFEVMPDWQRPTMQGREVRLRRVVVERLESGLVQTESLIAIRPAGEVAP